MGSTRGASVPSCPTGPPSPPCVPPRHHCGRCVCCGGRLHQRSHGPAHRAPHAAGCAAHATLCTLGSPPLQFSKARARDETGMKRGPCCAAQGPPWTPRWPPSSPCEYPTCRCACASTAPVPATLPPACKRWARACPTQASPPTPSTPCCAAWPTRVRCPLCAGVPSLPLRGAWHPASPPRTPARRSVQPPPACFPHWLCGITRFLPPAPQAACECLIDPPHPHPHPPTHLPVCRLLPRLNPLPPKTPAPRLRQRRHADSGAGLAGRRQVLHGAPAEQA
jgi:hypothetical protein